MLKANLVESCVAMIPEAEIEDAIIAVGFSLEGFMLVQRNEEGYHRLGEPYNEVDLIYVSEKYPLAVIGSDGKYTEKCVLLRERIEELSSQNYALDECDEL